MAEVERTKSRHESGGGYREVSWNILYNLLHSYITIEKQNQNASFSAISLIGYFCLIDMGGGVPL